MMISESLRSLFDSPPRSFSPTPLWWWSGGAVTPERLEWQMEAFARGGVYNLVVINLAPAGPIFGAESDQPAWFSESWWARFVQTCEIAERLDMKIWFYDQIGFSGANIQGGITATSPWAAGENLLVRESVVAQGRLQLRGQERLLAAYGVSGQRLEVGPSATVSCAAEGSSVQVAVAVPTAYDYLQPEAVALLLDTVHGEFGRRVPHFLGGVIAGSFQDELPSMNTWTPGFADAFADEFGYDVLDELPALWGGLNVEARKLRCDYYALRTSLAERSLFQPLSEWHSSRGMLVGADQSNPARAGYPSQSTQIYSDYFRTHRWYGAAGSDHEGDSKVHSSMAHLYAHERVWLEAFHSSGWGGTLEDTYDWLVPFLRAGANLYNPHASYFGTAGGWFEWAPPSTDWRQPYWQHYPQFSDAVSRIGSILTWGDYTASVAVLHPTTTAQAVIPLGRPVRHFGSGDVGDGCADADQAQQTYLELCGSNNWFHTRISLLDRAGRSFDVIDDDSIQRAEVEAGELLAPATRYRTVLLPSTKVLEEGTARRLVELLEKGGRVIAVGGRPELTAGRAQDDSAVRRLAAHPGLLFAATSEEAVALIPVEEEYATSDVPLLVRRDGPDAVAFVSGAFPNASAHPLRAAGDWFWSDYDFDASRYTDRRTVEVTAPVESAEVWNPANGQRRAAAVTATPHGSVIEVDVDGAPAVLVVWREGPVGSPSQVAAAGPREVVDLTEGWTGELVATMDNTWGDLAAPAGGLLTTVQLWELEWAEPALGSEPQQAGTPAKTTYGQRLAVSSAPFPADPGVSALTPEQIAGLVSGEGSLMDEGWQEYVYSSSRAMERSGQQHLGNKGMVPEEFVKVPSPQPGEGIAVRTFVRTGHRGEAELVVAAPAVKRVWWNGVELPVGEGYLTSALVEVAGEVNLLEYHLGASEAIDRHAVGDTSTLLGSFFTLARVGSFPERPQFMTVGDAAPQGATVTFSRSFSAPPDVASATLIVGSAAAVTVAIDAHPVAFQAKAEYYESEWGALPAYFEHDVTERLTAGEHQLSVSIAGASQTDVIFVDLALRSPSGIDTVVSDGTWSVDGGLEARSSSTRRGHWGELAAQFAVNRPHPLPEASWLRGPAPIGGEVLRFDVTNRLTCHEQTFTAVLPSGTTELLVPTRTVATVAIAGASYQPVAGRVVLAEPSQAGDRIEVRTPADPFMRGGAAWSGPIEVTTAPAPTVLGDWQQAGLAAWSGGVRYSRTIDLPSAVADVVLDLGKVRGSVEVAVDGQPWGVAFCAPFRFDLGDLGGRHDLTVTVYNTLAPYLAATSPTQSAYPSQLVSGLLSSVTLSFTESR